MDAKKLSKRLAAVANMVDQNARIADIGSDHAYLPTNLVLNKKITFAVAGEVVEGPFQNAQHEIVNQQLTDRIKVRLADGLAAIKKEDNVDTVVIAGMGGLLISKILDEGNRFPNLILQPNTDEMAVRIWLQAHNYKIIKEDIVAEGQHTYEIIQAHTGKMMLNRQQLKFGPDLLKKRPEIWQQKWQHEIMRKKKVLKFLQKAKKQQERILETSQEINLIEEVLGCQLSEG
ncbi:tRNA (adenine(22)-N(1))-methyltransferase [Periweissella beninensis]|uniref:tRNA (adenine(22)-N(1))-methyltransferase n=1 Tax=Periweissella beninensis TaxID=504936 RepID=UPI0021A8D57F|nr:tRNA (adenine(22)-N(1))-methyltransferase TrmK [Periweissella beninensis]MCT4396789.1 tRNA (adenine-N(1))-methyltransferase [Periweissella beninensis]